LVVKIVDLLEAPTTDPECRERPDGFTALIAAP
jgi:hypothetical protein